MAPHLRTRVSGRGLARSSERSSPLAGEFSNSPVTVVLDARAATSSDPPAVPFTRPPHTVKALAGAITILGVIVLAYVAWRIRSWRLARKAASAPSASAQEKTGYPAEKRFSLSQAGFKDLKLGTSRYPSKAYLLPPVPPTPDVSVGWVPQIKAKPTPSAPITGPAPVKSRASRSPRIKEKLRATMSSFTQPRPSPPPNYAFAGRDMPPMPITRARSRSQSSIDHFPLPPPPPPMPAPSGPLPTPPTPPASLKLKKVPSPDSVPPPIIASPQRTVSVKKPASPAAVKTPTSSASASQSSCHGGSSSSSQSKKLPRLVKVIALYPPSQPDELEIKMGDTLRLLEEYEDEWCLVQRVGGHDAEKGVVPQFCLEDRPEIIPTHKHAASFGSSFGAPTKVYGTMSR